MKNIGIMGHSMGGKTAMSFLKYFGHKHDIKKSIIIDILPVDYHAKMLSSSTVQDKTLTFLCNL